MSACPRCMLIPPAMPLEGYLLLAPPEPMAQSRLTHELSHREWAFAQLQEGLYGIQVTRQQLKELTESYFLKLSQLELSETKFLLLEDQRQPTFQELMKVRPLSALVAEIHGEWLREVIEEERLISHFQPILACEGPPQIFAYECLLRGRHPDGRVVYPGDIFSYAKSADLLFYLDRAARLTAIRCANQHSINTKLFINFMPTAIYDPEYCLRTTVAAIESSSLSADQIVFEVTESEEVRDVEHLVKILRYYRENGYKVALDDLGAGYSSLNLLHRLQPDYIKLDIGLIRGVDQEPYKAEISSNLLTLARNLGVRTIAEGVETEGELHWLKEHGADLVQGYYFAKPSEIPITSAQLTAARGRETS